MTANHAPLKAATPRIHDVVDPAIPNSARRRLVADAVITRTNTSIVTVR
jgi:hypothetical protein